MHKVTLALAVFLFTALTGFSQVYKDYTWIDNPALHQIAPEDSGSSELILKEKLAIEFDYDEQTGVLFQYDFTHKIIRVNSDEAIEQNNKIYLPMYAVKDLILNKVRVVTSDGKVKELNEDNIKEAVDESGRQSYKYYAIEGIDKGSEIEYIHLIKRDASSAVTGQNIVLQSDVTRYDLDLEIISPRNLVFTSYAQNMEELKEDTTYEEQDKNCLSIHFDKIEELEQEDQAVYLPHLKQVNVKLGYNLLDGQTPLVSYSNVTKVFHEQYFPNYDVKSPVVKQMPKKEKKAFKKMAKGEQKAYDKIMAELNLAETGSVEDRVRALEDSLKKKYRVFEYDIPALGTIHSIQENRMASEKGFVQLYLKALEDMGIESELVFTTNRYTLRFPSDFEAYNYLNEVFIYINDVDMYLDPSDANSRLGIIDYRFQNNFGLFIKEIQFDEYKTAIGEVRFIEPLTADKTGEQIDLAVTFGEDLNKVKVDVHRALTGYYAQGNGQTYYDFVNEEGEKELNDNLVKFITEDMEILDSEIKNKGGDHFGKDPLVVDATFESTTFVEKAGDKYIFKVGDLIGPQMEMYREKERKFDVENTHTRTYKRHIELDVPDGYQIKNLDAIKINHEYTDEDGKLMGFVSDYKVDGDKVIVDVLEYYNRIAYPKEKYEEYRTVINAAADFNKVVFFLEKE